MLELLYPLCSLASEYPISVWLSKEAPYPYNLGFKVSCISDRYLEYCGQEQGELNSFGKVVCDVMHIYFKSVNFSFSRNAYDMTHELHVRMRLPFVENTAVTYVGERTKIFTGLDVPKNDMELYGFQIYPSSLMSERHVIFDIGKPRVEKKKIQDIQPYTLKRKLTIPSLK